MPFNDRQFSIWIWRLMLILLCILYSSVRHLKCIKFSFHYEQCCVKQLFLMAKLYIILPCLYQEKIASLWISLLISLSLSFFKAHCKFSHRCICSRWGRKAFFPWIYSVCELSSLSNYGVAITDLSTNVRNIWFLIPSVFSCFLLLCIVS